MGVADRDIELFNLYTKDQCDEMIKWFHSEEDKGNTLSQTYDTVEDVPDYVNGNRVPPYARIRYIKSEERSYKFAEAYFPPDHELCIEQLNKVKEHGKKNGVEIKSMIGLVIQRYLTGGEVAWHTDKSPSLVDGQWQQMIYSTSCQLGDDYEGGELVFGRDRLGREKEAPLPSAPTIPLGQLPMDEMKLRNNTTQAPVDNTGNTVAQNLRENPILPFGFENIPETPMPGETPDSARMIEQASQMGQNPSIPFGREAMPTPTGQMTDAQRAVMSQSGSRMMPPTPEQQEAMRRNAQAQNAPQRTLDEFGFSRFG